MFVSPNIDKFNFHEVVGMLKAPEIKLDDVGNHIKVNMPVPKITSKVREWRWGG